MAGQTEAFLDSAKESARLLSGVLVTLQEIALADPNPARREAVLQIAESAAAVMGDLFALRRSEFQERERVERMNRALDGLRAVLSAVQVAAATSPQLDPAVEPLARTVAILFASIPRSAGAEASAAKSARAPSAAPTRTSPVVAPVDRTVRFVTHDDPEPSIPLTRPSRRFAERVKIEVEVGFVSESTFYAGLSLDISTGGLFVATYDIHPVGTQMAVTLVLPAGQELVVTGVVRWVREPQDGKVTPGMGIEFSSLSPVDLAAVEAFCKARTPMYFDP